MNRYERKFSEASSIFTVDSKLDKELKKIAKSAQKVYDEYEDEGDSVQMDERDEEIYSLLKVLMKKLKISDKNWEEKAFDYIIDLI